MQHNLSELVFIMILGCVTDLEMLLIFFCNLILFRDCIFWSTELHTLQTDKRGNSKKFTDTPARTTCSSRAFQN